MPKHLITINYVIVQTISLPAIYKQDRYEYLVLIQCYYFDRFQYVFPGFSLV